MKKKCLFFMTLFLFLFMNKVSAATFINRIDINYDTSKVKVSPAYTYNELKSQFTHAWVVADDANYSKGNNNIWLDYCPTSERCTDGWSNDYGINVLAERYTWVDFEVFAKPFGLDKENPDYDFDKDHLDEIDIYVNGVKRDDAMVRGYNNSWRLVHVYIPIEVDTSSFVNSIKVASEYTNVAKGETALFVAEVSYYGEGYNEVNWTISNNTSEDTIISEDGILTVALDEEAENLTIRATSTHDGTIYGEKSVRVLDALSVDSISVKPTELTVVPGADVWLSATVTGNAPHNVIWEISGATSENTYITEEGNLKVALEEEARTLTVTATSSYDATKKATATVTINEGRTYINRIDINYDTNEAYLTTRSTYSDARVKFRNNWVIPDGALYSKGNQNIYFYYCETKEKCDFNEATFGSNETILDRYTWVLFEVYASPFGLNNSNPVNDFDKDNLDKVEVYVNGVKQKDAVVKNYNSGWRAVDVLFPVEVSTAKISQEMYFNYEEYTTYYEGDQFKNPIYHTTGDGEITYSSSNPETAIVDENTGYVLPNDIGEAIIYATAAETDDYASKTISYKIIIKRKEINPTVLVENQEYTGNEIKPEITVKYNDKVLVKNVDYEVIYEDNINVGNATIKVKSLDTSKYLFEKDVTFYIDRKPLVDENVIVPEIIAYDNGSPLTPNVTVKVNGKTLVKDTDYTLSYGNQTASIGSHVTVYVSGTGNYKGSITKEVLVEDPASLELEVPNIKIEKGIGNKLVLNVLNNTISATYEIYRSTNKTKGFTKIAEVEDIAYVDSNLTYGATYYYKVIAKNNYDKTDYSNLVSMKVLPDKVEGLNALTISTNQVKLGWTKFDDMTGYEIIRSTKINGRYTLVVRTKNIDNYTNTRLSANTTYFYKVRAFKIVGRTKVYGAYSDSFEVKTAPVAPKIALSVDDYDTVAIKLYAVKGAAKYEVYRSLAKKGEYEKIAELPEIGTYKDGLLVSGKTYFYKVRACNTNDSCGNYSSALSKTPVPKTPSITITTNEAKRAVINITEINGADGYEVYRSLYRNRRFVSIGTTDTLEFIDEIKLNTRYYYKVRAYRMVDEKKVYGGYSSYKYTKVSLNTPTFTLSKKALNQANININAVSGAAGYEIYRSTNRYRGFKLVTTTDTLENVDNLILNTTYYYKVRAFIVADGKKYYSKYSSLKSIKLTLGTPTFTTNQTNRREVTLNINSVPDAEGYEIYRSLYKNKKFTLVATTGELETLDIVNLNTNYYYKVRAYVTIDGKKYYSNYSSLKNVKLVVGTPTFNLEGQEEQVEVTINEVTYADGYEIYRATSKYGKFVKVGETLESAYNDPAQANKTYYYKVRAYMIVDEKRIYSNYSAIKYAKALQLSE